MAGGEYQGLQDHIRRLDLPELETVENQYPDKDYHVRLEIPEFNSICPRTGLPDFAVVTIDYVPDRKLVELKSLKLYITAYRNVGIFQEHAANRILEDFVRAVEPRSAELEAVFNPRGGIRTAVRASYRRGEGGGPQSGGRPAVEEG